MKKLLVPILLTWAVLSLLSACGGTGAEEQVDTTTVAGYLSQFGLTEEDIKPAGFVSFEGPDEDGVITITADADQFDAWGSALFEKTRAISSNKTCYPIAFPYDEDPVVWEDGLELVEWTYKYKGKTVALSLPRADTVYTLHIRVPK